MRWLQLTLFVFLIVLSACNSEQSPTPDTPPTSPPDNVVQTVSSGDICPNFVQDALDTTDGVCDQTGRNQACFGNSQITVNPKVADTSLQFGEPGDIVDIIDIGSLRLEPLNLATETWGVVLLRLQANLSDTTPGQNVTFLMFGDVELENRSEDETSNINSFYFASGVGDAACASAPESGLIIQTPEGVGKVDLLLNEVSIAIGSTAYVQAQPNADMIVNVVEGQANVTSQGVTETVNAGNRTTIALDESGIAQSPPTPPEPYDIQPLRQLPTRNLPRPITITENTLTLPQASDPADRLISSVSGEILTADAVDVYPLSVEANQTLYFDGVERASDIRWNIYDADDNAIEDYNRLITDDIQNITFDTAGDYTVKVWGNNGALGTYVFQIWEVPPPNQLTLIRPDDAPDALIGETTGNIETPGVVDIYTFEVEAGQTLYFDGIKRDSDIRWNIFGADDTAISDYNQLITDDIQNVTFDTTGTYTLKVWGNTDNVGEYALKIWEVPPPNELTLTRPNDAPDTLIGETTGNIDTPGVIDIYTFEVEASQTLYFDGIKRDSDIRWNIFDAEGIALNDYNQLITDDIQNVTFDGDATFTLKVWGNNDNVGEYALQIWEVPPPNELTLTRPDDASDALIGEGIGEIDTPGVVDIYTFDVTAGQTLYFDGIDRDSDIRWNIFDAEGIALNDYNQLITDDIQNVTFDGDATFTLKVWGNNDNVGEYALKIWEVPPPNELTLTRPDDASDALIGEGIGDIDTPGVIDIYTFEVTAGQTLYFDGIDRDSDIRWNIYGADDIAFSDYNQLITDAIGNVTFDVAGTYTVRVWGNNDNVGNYAFEVRKGE